MIGLFNKITRSDQAMKMIFDHYKNFVVAGLVVGMGVKIVADPILGWAAPVRVFSGYLAILVGVLLAVLNERHGMQTLQKADIGAFKTVAVMFVYGMSTWSILLQIVLAHV